MPKVFFFCEDRRKGWDSAIKSFRLSPRLPKASAYRRSRLRRHRCLRISEPGRFCFGLCCASATTSTLPGRHLPFCQLSCAEAPLSHSVGLFVCRLPAAPAHLDRCPRVVISTVIYFFDLMSPSGHALRSAVGLRLKDGGLGKLLWNRPRRSLPCPPSLPNRPLKG